MKLISWNCQGAFRKKAEIILQHRPDILVVQECEHPDKLVFTTGVKRPKDVLWFGDNKHKGLGIFSYGKYKFRLLEQYNADIKIITPISVTGGKIDFTLIAIWANNHNDPDGQYVEQVWKAINHYDELLDRSPVILTGDFNSNTIWDKPRRIGNHSAVVKKLEEKKIYSAYHKYLNHQQGKEENPTFFLYRNKEKSYHMDYCFTSADLYKKIKFLEVGTFENWRDHSDHTPLMVKFNL